MKTKTKALLLALCAVMLVVATVFVTMAFLTSTDAVTNTFTVGLVKITLDEADVDVDGEKETDERVKANEYKLMPGHEYIKDPVVHVDSASEDCWLFVKLENGLVEIIDDTTIEDQMTENGWSVIDSDNNIWAYEDISSADENVPVFETFKLKDDADATDYADAVINVTAYAVQADGFETATDAWEKTFGATADESSEEVPETEAPAPEENPETNS